MIIDNALTNLTVNHSDFLAGGVGLAIIDNLTTPTRRWHVAKTHGRWTVHREGRGWVWTSPTRRRYGVEPHDYRRGP